MLIFSERQPRHVLAEYESHYKTPGRIERWNSWRPSSASASLATATGSLVGIRRGVTAGSGELVASITGSLRPLSGTSPWGAA
jgi:hypothetical protein